MARKDISTSWDRENRNAMNDNFKELYDEFGNVVETVSEKAYSQVVDAAKLNWKEPVSTFADLPANANTGDTRMTKDTGKVYRFSDGNWNEIQQIDAGPVNEVDQRLTAQLADKASGEVFRYTQGGTTGSENVINVIEGLAGNGVAADVRGATISGGGGNGYENVIGSEDYNNVGTTNPKRPNMVGSEAHYAVIGGGYDNVNNALAGVLTGYHCYIAKEATHGAILSGSFHKVLDGDYSVITGGTANTINYVGGGAYSFIGAGSNNANNSSTAAIVTGVYNRIGSSTVNAEGSFIGSGYLNTVDGKYAAVPTGYECKATKDYSMARGKGAVANNVGESVFTTGKFKAAGDSGQSTMHLFRQTTGGIATQLTLDDNNTPITPLGVNTSILLKVMVTGIRVDAPGYAAFEATAHISRDSGAPVVNFTEVTPIYVSDPAYTMDIVVLNSAYQIRVKGVNGHTINWTAKLDTVWSRNI